MCGIIVSNDERNASTFGGVLLGNALVELTAEKIAEFHHGQMTDAYLYFGAHPYLDETTFTVWVPEVERVSVICWLNDHSEEEIYQMDRHPEDETIWQVRIPENRAGSVYVYEMETAAGEHIRKSDPFARAGEKRPANRSVVTPFSSFDWSAAALQFKRSHAEKHAEKPMAIYELHIGTWKRNKNGEFLTYRELAELLIPYVKKQGFTHIEVLPITEHPLDESWGYQTTGYFAPTSRYGTAADLKYFIEKCAMNGIGLFLDWVPGHFCQDLHGLALFNGQPLYEDSREGRRFNPEWGTLNFDIRRGEVKSFLISSAHYWLEEFKFDGFRMDALMKLLFIPNDEARVHNPEGKAFLQELTTTLRSHFPEAILIGEDAWHYPKVTGAVGEGGIGFHYKWNFGWMHDTLGYFETPPSERSNAHNMLSFALTYYYEEHYISIFSHDQVVDGQKSLLNKLPGRQEEKFRQLRLLLGFWMAHPGKKLLFMGQEFGHDEEWKFQPQLDWYLFDYRAHREIALFTKDVLAFYRSEKAMHELDGDPQGFLWLDPHNHEQCVIAFIRKGKLPEDECIIICNFSDAHYAEFGVGVTRNSSYRQVFTSNASIYGGTEKEIGTIKKAKQAPLDGQQYSIAINLPAYTISIWKEKKEGSGKA